MIRRVIGSLCFATVATVLNLTCCMSPSAPVNISSAATHSKGHVCSPCTPTPFHRRKQTHTSNTHSLAGTHTGVVIALIVAWNSHSAKPRANNKTQEQQMFDKEVLYWLEAGCHMFFMAYMRAYDFLHSYNIPHQTFS